MHFLELIILGTLIVFEVVWLLLCTYFHHWAIVKCFALCFLYSQIIVLDSYQWYLNNTAINGATNATHIATTSRAYYCVVVKSAYSQNSGTINIHQVSINEVAFEGLKIYPSPTKDIL